MNIIIPMAGMGKRMRPHTLTTAKPLLPVAGKPIVARLVEDILATANEKVDIIAFIVSPKFGKETEDMLLQIASRLGSTGKICYQEEALGTGHAILCAKAYLYGNVFVAFADTLFKADFKIDVDKDAIIWAQQVDDPSQFGVLKLDDAGEITAFVEKPQTFVSNLAIIGVYYFKDGENLQKELQFLIDNDIRDKGEYQLTNAMENMKNKGLRFFADEVEEWLDCGNKNATIHTNQRILEIKKDKEQLIADDLQQENSIVIPPCYIGEGVVLKNSIIGPHVSIGAHSVIEQSVISNTILQEKTNVKATCLHNTMLGKNVTYINNPEELSLGDFSIKE